MNRKIIVIITLILTLLNIFAISSLADYKNVIISTNSIGFTKGGDWHIGAYNGYNGEESLVTSEALSWAKFSPNLGVSAKVEIWIYNMPKDSEKDVKVEIISSKGVDTQKLDFSSIGSGWVSIGKFEFSGSNIEGVKLTKQSDNDRFLRVSSVKFELIEYTPNPLLSETNNDTKSVSNIINVSLSDKNCVKSGDWKTSDSVKDDNGKSTVFTLQKGASITYKPQLSSAARVKIYLYKVGYSGSDPEMGVEVKANNETTIKKIALDGEKEWLYIGEYVFAGNTKDYAKIIRQTDSTALHTRAAGMRFEIIEELFGFSANDSGEPETESDNKNSIYVEAKSKGFSYLGKWSQSNSQKGFNDKPSYFTIEKDASATYIPELKGKSTAVVYVYKMLLSGSDPKMQIEVNASGKKDIKFIDLNTGEKGWTEIGTYDFEGSGTEGVTITRKTEGTDNYTRINAVRFDIIKSEQAQTNIDKNVISPFDSNSVTKNGIWRTVISQKDYDGGKTLASNQLGSSVVFNKAIELAGTYSVEVYKVSNRGNGDSSMKTTVKANSKVDIKKLNLKNDDSGWEKIGEYEMPANGNIEVIFEREQKDNSLYSRVGSVRIVKMK